MGWPISPGNAARSDAETIAGPVAPVAVVSLLLLSSPLWIASSQTRKATTTAAAATAPTLTHSGERPAPGSSSGIARRLGQGADRKRARDQGSRPWAGP